MILIAIVNNLWPCIAHKIHGDPSTEYSSRQPQCSDHGHRLREHCPRFPCRGILQSWWSPYEMSDMKTGSLVHTPFIQGCPGSFTCLSIPSLRKHSNITQHLYDLEWTEKQPHLIEVKSSVFYHQERHQHHVALLVAKNGTKPIVNSWRKWRNFTWSGVISWERDCLEKLDRVTGFFNTNILVLEEAVRTSYCFIIAVKKLSFLLGLLLCR